MFGGAYGDARMPNWPHWHRNPLPGIATAGLRRDSVASYWAYKIINLSLKHSVYGLFSGLDILFRCLHWLLNNLFINQLGFLAV